MLYYTRAAPPHCVALRCVALRCVALRCVALRCVALRCVALRCVALRCVALRCVALRCVALRCVALRCVALRCIALHHCFIYTSAMKVCIAHGDPHYHTFDGPVHDYQGTGIFIMSQRKVASCQWLQDFQVIGFHQSFTNPDVSYLMWMELHVFLPSGTTKVKIGAGKTFWVSTVIFSVSYFG